MSATQTTLKGETMISERWIQQQENKLTCTKKGTPAWESLNAEIDEAKAERAASVSKLDKAGLRANRYPENCVITGQRVQGGEGYIHKNAAGKWDTYSKAGAAERFGV